SGGGPDHFPHCIQRELFAFASTDKQQSLGAKIAGSIHVNHVATLSTHLVASEQLADESIRSLVQLLQRAVVCFLAFVNGNNQRIRLDVVKLPELSSHFHFWILDFGFWISDYWTEIPSIQNPKSRIQNHLLLSFMARRVSRSASRRRSVSRLS